VWGVVMLLNVSQLLLEPSGSSREYQLEERAALLDGAEDSVVTGTVLLFRTDKSVWASASLNTEVRVECGRCLAAFGQPIDITIEEEFFPLLDPVTGIKEKPLDDDGEYQYLSEDHMLDLSGPARDCVLLDMPMKPLCNPTCAGLCSNCGVNRNDVQCLCDSAAIDPRWDALLSLAAHNVDEN